MSHFRFGPITFKGRPTRGASSSGYAFKHQDLGTGKHRLVIKDRHGRLLLKVTMSDREWVKFIGG